MLGTIALAFCPSDPFKKTWRWKKRRRKIRSREVSSWLLINLDPCLELLLNPSSKERKLYLPYISQDQSSRKFIWFLLRVHVIQCDSTINSNLTRKLINSVEVEALILPLYFEKLKRSSRILYQQILLFCSWQMVKQIEIQQLLVLTSSFNRQKPLVKRLDSSALDFRQVMMLNYWVKLPVQELT